MNKFRIFVVSCVVAIGTAMGGGVAGAEPPGRTATVERSRVSCRVIPVDSKVREFVGEAEMILPGERDEGHTYIAGRVMVGFEAGPSQLRIPNGPSISWGFRYGEGTVQSVVIYGPACDLELVAIVDGMPLIDGMTRTMDEYRRAVARQVADPHVTVFVQNAADLKTYLTFLYRWLEADLLGFNVNCKAPGMAEACALAAQVRLPLAAYQVPVASSKTMPKRLAIPEVKAADIPLSKFVQ